MINCKGPTCNSGDDDFDYIVTRGRNDTSVSSNRDDNIVSTGKDDDTVTDKKDDGENVERYTSNVNKKKAKKKYEDFDDEVDKEDKYVDNGIDDNDIDDDNDDDTYFADAVDWDGESMRSSVHHSKSHYVSTNSHNIQTKSHDICTNSHQVSTNSHNTKTDSPNTQIESYDPIPPNPDATTALYHDVSPSILSNAKLLLKSPNSPENAENRQKNVKVTKNIDENRNGDSDELEGPLGLASKHTSGGSEMTPPYVKTKCRCSIM